MERERSPPTINSWKNICHYVQCHGVIRRAAGVDVHVDTTALGFQWWVWPACRMPAGHVRWRLRADVRFVSQRRRLQLQPQRLRLCARLVRPGLRSAVPPGIQLSSTSLHTAGVHGPCTHLSTRRRMIMRRPVYVLWCLKGRFAYSRRGGATTAQGGTYVACSTTALAVEQKFARRYPPTDLAKMPNSRATMAL